jgi:hypothetical protein
VDPSPVNESDHAARILSSRDGVKHTALRDYVVVIRAVKYREMVSELCPSVERLTICNPSDNFFEYRYPGYEYQLVRVPTSKEL